MCYIYSNYFLFPFLYSRTNYFNVVALRALSDREFQIFGPLVSYSGSRRKSSLLYSKSAAPSLARPNTVVPNEGLYKHDWTWPWQYSFQLSDRF